MKNLFAFLLLILLSGSTIAQSYPGQKNFRKRSKNRVRTFKPSNGRYRRIELLGHIGASFGQETLIGLPKLGGICKLNFKRIANDYDRPFEGNSFYVGADLSMLVFFAGAFTHGVQVGFKFGPITIDNSLSKLVLMSPESEIVARQTSYNPKIGLVIGPAWLKFGPSFILKGENILHEGFRMNNFPYNIELAVIGKY